jgi:hypothetical protein
MAGFSTAVAAIVAAAGVATCSALADANSVITRYPSRSRGITTGRITRSIKPDNFIRSITP